MTQHHALIVSGSHHATTRLYRCEHLQAQLTRLGHRACVHNLDALERNPDLLLDYDLVILQRVPITQPLRTAIAAVQARGGRVLFDADDLVFVPELSHAHRAVLTLPTDEQRRYHDGVRRYAATLSAADAALVSTPLLADLARRTGKPAFVHRNGLGAEMTALAADLVAARRARPRGDRLILGYGSGTATHDHDFAVVAPALLYILAHHPHVDLWIAGPLQLPAPLALFEDRIRRLPLVTWQVWLETAAQFDINLAPLEIDNVFCRAKSAIKFSEAAILGVPTVATATDAFSEAIEHGVTGYVARHTGEWIAALERLIIDPTHRQQVGDAARADVLQSASEETRTAQLAAILEKIEALSRPASSSHGDAVEPAPDSAVSVAPSPEARAADPNAPLVINWIISEPQPGGGGPGNLFRAVNYLRRFGHEQRVYIVPVDRLKHASEDEIRRFIADHFPVPGVDVLRWDGVVADADATFATYWETAYQVAALHNGGRGYYLVQDYEPNFYAVGAQQIQAEQSYKLGLHTITLGHWLAKLMRERHGVQADVFDFAVDLRTYQPAQDPKPKWPPRINFYARPSTPRRGYEIGVEALRIVRAAQPDADIVLYGADHLPKPPDFYHRNLGIVSPWELARLYATSDVGLVLSLTNPSMTPLEMMACRCAVVDIDSDRVDGLLHHEEDALLAAPEPAAIAAAVLRLLHEPDLRQRIVDNAYQRAIHCTWDASIRQIESVLLRDIPAAERMHNRPAQTQSDAIARQIYQILDGAAVLSPSPAPAEDRWSVHSMEVLAQAQRTITRAEDALHAAASRHGMRDARRRHFIERWFGGGRGAFDGEPVHVLPLLDGPIYHQFVVDRPHLSRVEVLPAPPLLAASRPLKLTLHAGDENGPVVAERVFHAADVRPNLPLVFAFAPQPHASGQIYTLAFSSASATLADHHRFWCFDAHYEAQIKLYGATGPLPGQLVCQWACDAAAGWPLLAPDAVEWTQIIAQRPDQLNGLRTFVREPARLTQRSLDTVSRGGVGQLFAELRSYVRWRLRR